MLPTETRMLDVEGTRLFARLVGEESLPLLIVMHGGPGLDHTEFAEYLDPLADTVRLALIDLRANGAVTGAVRRRPGPSPRWRVT